MSNHTSVKSLEIHNSDLQWNGTPLGLQPRIVNAETSRLVDAPTTTDRDLVELLLDPDRFAAAHVLLTMRRNALTSFDASQWNGLRVALAASGGRAIRPRRYEDAVPALVLVDPLSAKHGLDTSTRTRRPAASVPTWPRQVAMV